MPKNDLNVTLKGIDELLFSTEEQRQEEKREQVQQIPIDELHPFTNHPFKVVDDEAMTRTVESIAQFGVLAPLIARPRPDGDGYEIISGHRRQYAAKLAGLETLPVIVRDMDDDAATILMVDSNLQREHISPSERAFAYKMKLDALKNQGARSDLTSRQVVGKLEAADVIGKATDESGRQVQRYVRLTNLIPELLNMVDEKMISFNPAVELSYLSPEQQQEMIKAIAILFLLERMEYAASEREQLLMLNQQIQLQSKNMTSASELYSAQRKKVHDFRAHLNILNQLMKNQEYSAAEEYLEKITEQQTDRLFLVNTHHPILDALFNTKAAEATQKKISIDFEVNDLSKLPFYASDMVVLLSNLLDNAIEACQQYDKDDKAIHVMAVAQQDFFISVRNTSEPVVIINGSIPTTKPEPQMHGFGLANIRLILEKYSGEYTMFYENGWFQFTADIPFTPIS